MNVGLFDKWWLQLIKGIIFSLAGVLMIKAGAYEYLENFLAVGIFLIIFGLADVLTSFSHKNLNFAWQWLFAEGLIFIFFGFICIIRHDLDFTFFQLFIGTLAAITGIIHFSSSINFKNSGILRWFLVTLNGIFSIAIGILIIFPQENILFSDANLIALYLAATGLFSALISFLVVQVSYDYT